MKNITFILLMVVLVLSDSCVYSQQQLNNVNYLNEKPPGLTAKIFARGIISTKDYEHGSPEFSPSYDEIYWGIRKDSEYGKEIIRYIKKGENGWSESKYPSFSIMGKGDLYPAFSRDGKELYFTSDRSGKSNSKINNRNIWKVRKNGEEWTEPEIVGFDSLDIYGLSISPKRTLYFMAQEVKDRGTMIYNIYCSEPENSKYNRTEKLGYPISTEHFEDGPFISGDERFLLFESTRPGGYGGNDLYLSIKAEDGTWSVPENLGKLINSEFSERFPYISPDGKYFFFGSNRNGNFDIYWISASVIYRMIND